MKAQIVLNHASGLYADTFLAPTSRPQRRLKTQALPRCVAQANEAKLRQRSAGWKGLLEFVAHQRNNEEGKPLP